MLQNRSQDLAIFFQAEENPEPFQLLLLSVQEFKKLYFYYLDIKIQELSFYTENYLKKAVLLHLHGMLKIQAPAYPHPANQKTAQACHRLLPATQFHRKSSFHGIHALPPVHFHVYEALQIQEQATHLQI